MVVIGDFNAKLSSWCISDESNYEGVKVHYLTIQYDLKQVINEPSHLLENSSSCIYLIFRFQPNLVMDADVQQCIQNLI